MKIRPVGAELFHVGKGASGRTDGLIDMAKLIVVFRNLRTYLKNIFVLIKL